MNEPTSMPSNPLDQPTQVVSGELSVANWSGGRRYGRFAVQHFHAKGGLGEVHVATDSELHRRVALKRMQERCLHDANARRRFLNEAEITAQLEHPGIVPIYGLVQDEHGQPCYAMRFIEGESLGAAIKRFHGEAPHQDEPPGLSRRADGGDKPRRWSDYHSLAFRQLLQRLISVCNTIAYAHSKHIIHRDIKPANVMLGPFGETLMVDWGLAREVAPGAPGESSERSANEAALPSTVSFEPAGSDTRVGTQAGHALGTLGYMAPEQAAGRWNVVGPRSDIYSLGATLYELLTGQKPVRGGDPQEALQQAQAGRFPPPRQIHPAVPEALEAVCRTAMAFEPAQRYATAKDLADDLEHWLANEPLAAWPEPWRVRAGRWLRRHRTIVTTAAALLVTAVIGLAAGLAAVEGERRHTDRERQAAARERDQKGQVLEQAVAALRDLTDDVVEKQMARGPQQLSEENKEFLRKIIQHFEALAALTGADADSRALRAEGYFRVGEMRYRLGEFPDAESAHRSALAIRKELAAEFPDRLDFRQHLANSYNNLGNLFRVTRRFNEAEAAFTDAVAIRKQLAADFPSRAEFRRELGRGLNNMAVLLFTAGRAKEAESIYEGALAIQKQLVAEFPDRFSYLRDLAGSYNNLGVLHGGAGRFQEAEVAYSEALAVQKRLVAEFPNVPDFRNEVAGSLVNLADLARRQSDLATARQRLEEALPYHQAALQANPRRPDYRQFYHVHLLQRTWCCAGQRDRAGALTTARTMRDRGWDSAADSYDAAAALAQCVAMVRKDDKLDDTQRPADELFYTDQAMILLREAIAKGYKDIARIKKDPDLNALRPREDFQKLLQELEEKK